MADDKTKTGGDDRARVAGDQPYEVEHFARKHGLTAQQARDLIARHGDNREQLDRDAERLKAG